MKIQDNKKLEELLDVLSFKSELKIIQIFDPSNEEYTIIAFTEFIPPSGYGATAINFLSVIGRQMNSFVQKYMDSQQLNVNNLEALISDYQGFSEKTRVRNYKFSNHFSWKIIS